MTNGVLTDPLTNQQIARLRGGHKTRWLAFLNPNTVTFKCLINQVSFSTSFAEFTYDNVTVGSYTDVKEGWTVYVSADNNIQHAYFRGRVRKVPTSNTFYVNWTSAAFQDNHTVWVCKDTALHEKLPRKSNGTIYFDYDTSFRQLLPYIENLPTAVAGKLTSGGNVDFPFAPTAKAAASGATISTWAWEADDGTFQSGSSSSQNVTIRFTTAGWREIRLTVTDSDGRSNFFTIRAIVYPANYASVVSRDILPKSLTNDIKTGWSASFDVTEGTDLDNMLRLNEIVIVAEDTFTTTLSGVLASGSAVVTGLSSTTALSAGQTVRGRGIPAGTTVASVDSASQVTLSASATRSGRNGLKFLSSSIISNVKFVGRIRESDDETALDPVRFRLRRKTLEADGMAAQLGRLILATVALRRKTTPAVMGEIKDLTLWRAILFLLSELTTFTNIASLDFDSTNDDYTVPLIGTQDRSAQDNAEDVAFAINAFFNWSPTGAAMVARHVHYLSDKSGVITTANWTAKDFIRRFQVRRQHIEPMGRVIGYAGTFNTSSEKTLVLRAKAPAEIWGAGEGRSQVNRQVLKANLTLAQSQFEVAYRTGAEYAARNLLYTLNVTHPSGYDNVLNPSVYQRVTWTEGEFDSGKFWLCTRVQINYDDQKRQAPTEAFYIEDITGITAQVIAEIAPEDLPFQVPGLAPWVDTIFEGLPGLAYVDGADIPLEDEQPYTQAEAAAVAKPGNKTTDPAKKPPPVADPDTRQGSVVMTGNASGVWLSKDFARTSRPNWNNITPGTGVNHGIFNRHATGGWVLTDDGTDSIVWRTDNILNSTPTWNSVSLVDNVMSQIRNAAVPGEVYVYGSGEDDWTEVFDHAANGLDGWSFVTDDFAADIGVVSPGNGLAHTDGTIGGQQHRGVFIAYNIAIPTLTSVELLLDYTAGGSDPHVALFIDGVPQLMPLPPNGTDVTTSLSTGWSVGSQIAIQVTASFLGAYSGSVLLKQVTLRGTGANPFGGPGGGAFVTRYSTDNGASFAASVAVGGDAVSDGGFDTMRDSSAVFAAADEIIRTATSGGAYSDATGSATTGSYARAIWAYGSSSFLMASNAAVGGETLWKVVSGVPAAITPNDGSNDGLVVGPGALCTAPEDSDVIFALMSFGGTVKLARSTNGGVSWAFTTAGIGSGANWVRCKNADQVYICNGSSILYSEDGGASFVTKLAPGSSLLFVEVR